MSKGLKEQKEKSNFSALESKDSGKHFILKYDIPYVDFEYGWGIKDQPTIRIEAKGGYIVTMDNTCYVDFEIKASELIKKEKLILFAYKKPDSMFDWMISEDEREICLCPGFRPLLISVRISTTNFFDSTEMILPNWCPFPNIEGKIVKDLNKKNILRVMTEIDREYGNYLNDRYRDGQV